MQPIWWSAVLASPLIGGGGRPDVGVGAWGGSGGESEEKAGARSGRAGVRVTRCREDKARHERLKRAGAASNGWLGFINSDMRSDMTLLYYLPTDGET